ncbi:acyltransferase [Andreprevotia sp. IGB-42]|uniref:acyltransferase family protein n=1 Tax=Andreprevotia sp. IGB-42 TaxID=2497473 RepID=UPI0013589411|nr:acyltransferase [Andreprevotia sp. IGB-42]
MRFDNINLLRAFAAIAVVVYHVIEHTNWVSFPHGGPWVIFRLGWMGVDLFFVISGFLITYSALLLYRKTPATFASNYWRRRLTRILPLYLLTMTLWIAFCWDGFFLQDTRDWVWQLFTHLTFIHSFWPETHGAIDGANWSLALEMQFYLLIALLIRWIDRTPGWLIWVIGISIAWAWRATMLVLYGHGETFTLFLHITQLPGTLDEFGAGMFLAKYVLAQRDKAINQSWRPSRQTLGWLAACLLAGYVTMKVFWAGGAYWDKAHMVIFWRTLLATALMCVLALAIYLPQVIAMRWMHPVDQLGEISYGIYLWHLFAIQFAAGISGITSLQTLVVVLALTLLAAMCSWHYMEKPIMEMAR